MLYVYDVQLKNGAVSVIETEDTEQKLIGKSVTGSLKINNKTKIVKSEIVKIVRKRNLWEC